MIVLLVLLHYPSPRYSFFKIHGARTAISSCANDRKAKIFPSILTVTVLEGRRMTLDALQSFAG